MHKRCGPVWPPTSVGRGWVLALALLAGVVCALPAAARERVWAGVVNHVADGDTVHVKPLRGGRPVKIRLHGVDAPEICQSGGATARDALRQRVLGQQVVVHALTRDRYGRTVARIMHGGEDVGESLVRLGLAWAYYYRAGAGPYAALQRQAQAAHRGVFAAARPQPPNEFRRQHGSCH